MATIKLSIQEMQGLIENYKSEQKKLDFQSDKNRKSIAELEKSLKTAKAAAEKEKARKDKEAAQNAKAKAAKAAKAAAVKAKTKKAAPAKKSGCY